MTTHADMDAPFDSKQRGDPALPRPSRWPIIALLLTTAVIFSPVITMPFLEWDDVLMIVTNDDLKPDNWPSILRYWLPTHPHLGLYIPVTYGVYFVLACSARLVSGALIPGFFHSANLAVHLAAGWLVWRLLTRLGAAGSAAILGAGLFLLHPLQVEAVAWAASLNTVLAGAGSLAALAMYVDSVRAIEPARRRVCFAASCVALVLALLAKPSVCGVPLAAIAIDRLLLDSSWTAALRRGAVWVVFVLPIVIAGKLAQPARTISSPLSWRPIVVADTLGFYLAKVIAPVGLTVDYGRKPAFIAAIPVSTIAFAACALLTFALIVWHRRGRPWLVAGVIVFVAGLAPVLGFIDFDFQQYSTVADRYIYSSMLGVAIAAVFGVGSNSVLLTRWITCALLLGCAVLSSLQLRYWHSDALLFERTMTLNRESFAVHGMLAKIEADAAARGVDDAAQRRIRASARVHYEHALAIRPDDQAVRLAFAQLLERDGDVAAAIDQYAIASERGLWNDARLHVRWGLAFSSMGRHADAIAHLRRAVALDVNSADAHAALGVALARADQQTEALTMFARALAIDPKNARAIVGLMTPPMIRAP